MAREPRGSAGRPGQPGRSCPVSLLTSAILVPLGRTSSAEPSPRMGRLSQSQQPPPPPPRSARHPPGGGGGSAPYRAGQPTTPPAPLHAHPARRPSPRPAPTAGGPPCTRAHPPLLSRLELSSCRIGVKRGTDGSTGAGQTHVQLVEAKEPAMAAEDPTTDTLVE